MRGDGVLAIFYPAFENSSTFLHQLALTAGRWVDTNLTAQAQPPFTALIKAVGFVRPGTAASIIHPQGGLQELALGFDGIWKSTNLLNGVSAPGPHPLRWPVAFMRAGGIPSILYVDDAAFIHELAFAEGQWKPTALTESVNAPKMDGSAGPMGYIRADGVTAVMYCGADKHMHELTLVNGRWQHADLSRSANTDTFGYPSAYVRGDGVSSVIYVSGQDRHIHELSLAPV